MPSPFPGMDPYLESPELWPDVHHELISQIRSALNPGLRPKYVARVEMRVYLSDDEDPGRSIIIPDVRVDKTHRRNGGPTLKATSSLAVTQSLVVPMLMEEEVEEAFLEIRQIATGKLVTIIEVLSPANKVRGSNGRLSFLKKKKEALDSNVHWVEIDLLRAGTPSVTRPALKKSDYRILVCRAENQTQARFWPVSVREPLPVVGIPLRKPDPEVPLDLGAVLKITYERTAYDLSVDYRKKPDPPLEGTGSAWASRLLRAGGLR